MSASHQNLEPAVDINESLGNFIEAYELFSTMLDKVEIKHDTTPKLAAVLDEIKKIEPDKQISTAILKTLSELTLDEDEFPLVKALIETTMDEKQVFDEKSFNKNTINLTQQFRYLKKAITAIQQQKSEEKFITFYNLSKADFSLSQLPDYCNNTLIHQLIILYAHVSDTLGFIYYKPVSRQYVNSNLRKAATIYDLLHYDENVPCQKKAHILDFLNFFKKHIKHTDKRCSINPLISDFINKNKIFEELMQLTYDDPEPTSINLFDINDRQVKKLIAFFSKNRSVLATLLIDIKNIIDKCDNRLRDALVYQVTAAFESRANDESTTPSEEVAAVALDEQQSQQNTIQNLPIAILEHFQIIQVYPQDNPAINNSVEGFVDFASCSFDELLDTTRIETLLKKCKEFESDSESDMMDINTIVQILENLHIMILQFIDSVDIPQANNQSDTDREEKQLAPEDRLRYYQKATFLNELVRNSRDDLYSRTFFGTSDVRLLDDWIFTNINSAYIFRAVCREVYYRNPAFVYEFVRLKKTNSTTPINHWDLNNLAHFVKELSDLDPIRDDLTSHEIDCITRLHRLNQSYEKYRNDKNEDPLNQVIEENNILELLCCLQFPEEIAQLYVLLNEKNHRQLQTLLASDSRLNDAINLFLAQDHQRAQLSSDSENPAEYPAQVDRLATEFHQTMQLFRDTFAAFLQKNSEAAYPSLFKEFTKNYTVDARLATSSENSEIRKELDTFDAFLKQFTDASIPSFKIYGDFFRAHLYKFLPFIQKIYKSLFKITGKNELIVEYNMIDSTLKIIAEHLANLYSLIKELNTYITDPSILKMHNLAMLEPHFQEIAAAQAREQQRIAHTNLRAPARSGVFSIADAGTSLTDLKPKHVRAASPS